MLQDLMKIVKENKRRLKRKKDKTPINGFMYIRMVNGSGEREISKTQNKRNNISGLQINTAKRIEERKW